MVFFVFFFLKKFVGMGFLFKMGERREEEGKRGSPIYFVNNFMS